MHRGIGQERANLAVLRPPGRPAGLPLHPRGPDAFLDETGFIGDQDPGGVAQVLNHVVPHVIADPIHVPVLAAQQPLHPIRADLASAFRQRPPVLAFQARDQPRHIFPDPGPRLCTPEPARDPLMHPVQLTRGNINHHAFNDARRIT